MFALIAAIIFFLISIGVLDSSEDVDWFVMGLASWALHFAIGWGLPFPAPWERRREP